MALPDDLTLSVNGREHRLRAAPQTPLLYLLRNDLALNGPKYGCGLGECGACAVLIDGRVARSCVLPARAALGRRVTTLEGLGDRQRPSAVQQAFIEAQAAQCGYCINGMIIAVTALLEQDPDPSETTIKHALRHQLCRCGTHIEIIQAARRAAEIARARRIEVHDADGPDARSPSL